MKYSKIVPALLAAGLIAAPVLTASPAAAQSVGSDAAIGAAVGTVISQLLFNQNNNQYYYQNQGRNVYVSNQYASQYFARRDPNYWRSNHRNFYSNRTAFNQGWYAGRRSGAGYARGYRQGYGQGYNQGEGYRHGHDHGHWDR